GHGEREESACWNVAPVADVAVAAAFSERHRGDANATSPRWPRLMTRVEHARLSAGVAPRHEERLSVFAVLGPQRRAPRLRWMLARPHPPRQALHQCFP